MNALVLPQFPYSRLQPFQLTSPPTPQYNCIAWAFGDTAKRYWPKTKGFFWPNGIRNEEDLQSFQELFGLLGYGGNENEELESGYTKVALFSKAGKPQHAARQLSSGLWTSKLGPQVDVSHSLQSMSNGVYGNVSRILKVESVKLGSITLPPGLIL